MSSSDPKTDQGQPPSEGPDQQLAAAVSSFDQFVLNLKSFEKALVDLPDQQRRLLVAKLEARLSSKVLQGATRSTTVFEVLQKVISAVQEINDILVGSRPVPDIKREKSKTSDDDSGS